MATKEKPEILDFKVSADIREALKGFAQFERDSRKFMGKFESATKKLSKNSVSAIDDMEDANDQLLGKVEDLTEALEKQEAISRKIVRLQEKSAKATGEEKDEIDGEIRSLSKLHTKTQALAEDLKKHRVGDFLLGKGAKEYRKGLESPKAGKSLQKMFIKSTVQGLKSGFNAFMSKDAKGVVAGLQDMLSGGVKAAGLAAGRKGAAWEKAGAAKKMAGEARGGMAGAGLKALGSAQGALGGMMSIFAKIGPLIGGVVTVIAKLVSLFIDAEAQAKAFNKEILQSASTAEFLGRNFNSTSLAMDDLETTLRGVRDAAYDAKTNLDWGITSETHKGVLNVLNQEGISIQSIGSMAKASGMEVKDFAKELVTTSVAYSRLLGVPLQEINQLQAEMVTELGTGVQETSLAFSQMARTATESGISANKFFSMIRGVSQDLSLWGNRMEDAVKLLGKLGKVMNPREAQKFMNTAMQGLKNMGRQERLRLTMLAGQGKMSKLVERDTQRKAKGLAEAVGMSADDLMKTMRSPKGLAEFSKKLSEGIASGKIAKEQEGALRGAAIEMKEQITAAGKGVFGTAIAARSMGPGGSLEAMKAALSRFGGEGKSLMEMRGELGAEMMAENLGISEEQLSQMVKFEQSMEMYRGELATRMQSLEEKASKGDAAAQAELAKIRESGIQTSKDIEKAGFDQLMDTMDENTKKAMEEQTKTQKDFAKEQTDLQTSMVDKLGILVDFIMNQLYNIMTDIWGVIMEWFGDSSKEDIEAEKAIYKSGNMDLIKAMQSGDLKGGLAKGAVGSQVGALSKTAEGRTKLSAIASKHMTGDELQKVLGASGVKMTDDQKQKMTAALTKTETFYGPEGPVEMLRSKGAGEADFGKALQDAGFTPEQQAQILEKVIWGSDRAKTLAGIAGDVGGGGAAGVGAKVEDVEAQRRAEREKAEAEKAKAEAAKAATPSPQAAAAAKAEGVPPAAAVAPATPGVPPQAAPATAAAGPVVIPPPPKEVIEFQDAQLDQLGYLGGQNDDIIRVLKKKVGLNKTLFETEIAPILEKSVLDAVRVALVEYKMYKDIDMETFSSMVQEEGFDPKKLGSSLLEGAQQKDLVWEEGDIEGQGKWVKGGGNAAGGYIMGRQPDGTAKVMRPPAGEMPAFVGTGETIVPKGRGAGGGSTSVTVNVNGIGGNDLAQMVKVAATNAIYEYKRRENLN